MPGQPVDDAFFARYQKAWSEGDIDGIVSMMTPDGLYEASLGPEPWGARYVGREQIREALHAMGVSGSNGHAYQQRYLVGDRGFSEWTSTSVDADGNLTIIHGADFYEFRNGLVSKKIAYRKDVRR